MVVTISTYNKRSATNSVSVIMNEIDAPIDIRGFAGKSYVVVTKWGYPFGGGEAFMYQSMKWALLMHMSATWLSFTAGNNNPHGKFRVVKATFDGVEGAARMVHIPGGFDERVLSLWLSLLQPDFVHHQGHERLKICRCIHNQRLTLLSGYHFWTDFIDLDPSTNNQHIIKNASKHAISPNLGDVVEMSGHVYVASGFMLEALRAVGGSASSSTSSTLGIIYPIPDATACVPTEMSAPLYVTQINVHKQKGGDLFEYLLDHLPTIPFLGVETEPDPSDQMSHIHATLTAHPSSKLMSRQKDVRRIYEKTKILLVPSKVDETFCRVALEAMYNAIPVVTTGCGFVSELVADAGFIIDGKEHEKWAEAVSLLWTNQDLWNMCSHRAKKRSSAFTEKAAIRQFSDALRSAHLRSPRTCVGIFVPWCDQGLGVQGRLYDTILRARGIRVAIFSYRSYFSKNSNDRHQREPSEWEHPAIYYSPNRREDVKDSELASFIEKWDVGNFIIPESCWYRVFEIARFLTERGVRCHAVPNIEIVRTDEIQKHRYFTSILCNNMVCMNVFRRNGLKNVRWVGYSAGDYKCGAGDVKSTCAPDIVRFSLFGGMNALSRKQAYEVCLAFCAARKMRDDIELVVTTQVQEDGAILAPLGKTPGITIKAEHLPHRTIMDLLDNTDVLIQVSKHEGLGLGFYEALSRGVPVITLETPPHNELILHGVNGWHLPCFHKPMVDNPASFLSSAFFSEDALCNLIVDIAERKERLPHIRKTLIADYADRFSLGAFSQRFAAALGIML